MAISLCYHMLTIFQADYRNIREQTMERGLSIQKFIQTFYPNICLSFEKVPVELPDELCGNMFGNVQLVNHIVA